MSVIDLGESWQRWTPKHNEKLMKAIKKIYGGHLPYSYSEVDVLNAIKTEYEFKRTENAVKEQFKKLLNNAGCVFKYQPRLNTNGTDFILLREYTDGSAFKEEIRDSLLSNQDKTRSVIALTSYGDKISYVFPTVLDADYVQIFSSIFCSKNKDKGYYKDLRMATSFDELKYTNHTNHKNNLFYYDADSEYISIPVPKGKETCKEKFLLFTVVQFFLDFLLSKLLGTLTNAEFRKNSGKSPKKIKVTEENIQQLLVSFADKFNYHFSQEKELLDATKKFHHAVNNGDYVVLTRINEKSNSETAVIPAFWISMTRVFERYAFALLYSKSAKHNLLYKYRIGDSSTPMEPDIISNSREFILDAKYKFQYGLNSNYCEIADVNRMVNYISYLMKPNDKETDEDPQNLTCIFLYPSIIEPEVDVEAILSMDCKDCKNSVNCINNKNHKDKKNLISKCPLFLPVNESFSLFDK